MTNFYPLSIVELDRLIVLHLDSNDLLSALIVNRYMSSLNNDDLWRAKLFDLLGIANSSSVALISSPRTLYLHLVTLVDQTDRLLYLITMHERILLQHLVTNRTLNRYQLLNAALLNEEPSIASLLINNGANLDSLVVSHRYYAGRGHLSFFKTIYALQPTLIDEIGASSLSHAVLYCRLDLLKWLLSHQSVIYAISPIEQEELLKTAFLINSRQLFDLLWSSFHSDGDSTAQWARIEEMENN